MTNLRLMPAVMFSLMLHGGFIYYNLFARPDFARVSAPIDVMVITVAVTQSLIEKQISVVEEIHTIDGGGYVSLQAEAKNAVIEVTKEKSQKEGKSTKKQVNIQKPEKSQKIEHRNVAKTKQVIEKIKSDEVEQQFKQGTGQAESLASGELGEQKAATSGENTRDVQLKYLAKVRNELERHKKYPRRARAMQIEGLVVVHFQITPQGELINAYVVESKYSEVFGKAVLDAIKRYKSVGVKPTSVNEFVSLEIHFNLDK